MNLNSSIMSFYDFLLAEEGIRLPQWSWDQLSRMTDQRQSSNTGEEDFHRCHAFRGIM